MNQEKIHILVVDDDPRLRKLLHAYLEEAGFDMTSVNDGDEMESILSSHSFDLVILDIMLPGEDGISLARKIGPKYSLPIIMLSAKSEEMDRVVGLEVGADDYIVKPFSPRELVARIKAVLRRRKFANNNMKISSKDVRFYHFGPFKLDVIAQTLYRNDQYIPLTSNDFKLLFIFLKFRNKILDRDKLLDLLKGYDRDPMDRSIDICVSRLRHKIEEDPSNPKYIRTIWSEGYILSTPVDSQ